MQRAAAFVTASVEDRERRARIMLEDDPRLARADIRAAAVVGDVRLVGQLLAADASAANALDHERGWPPLLYVCYSRWHRIDPGRAAGLVEVARLLLDAGVSPDTNNGARPHHRYRSGLHGSVTANNPGITRLLLERSANPNDGESLYQAAGHRDHECLRLLLNHGATVADSWAVDVAVGGNDAEAVRLLLDAAERQTPERVSELAGGLLARACAAGAARVVEELLAGGAKPIRLDQARVLPKRSERLRRDASARRGGRRGRGDGTPAARVRRRARRPGLQLRWHSPRLRDRHERRAPQHERRLGRQRPTPARRRRGPNRRLGPEQATERRRRRGAA
jgi:hypothetical protein